jgi:arginase
MRRVFALPYDSGHKGLRMGAGPLRLRELFDDVEQIDAPGEWRAEIRTSFVLYGLLATRVRDAAREGAMPIVLSGNCGACAGTVAGLGAERLGVVWLDAHGDLMTPDTTTSGFLDGMALSIVTGQCWPALAQSVIGLDPIPPERAIHIGGRSWSEGEIDRGRASGVAIVDAAAFHKDRDRAIGSAIDILARTCERVVFHVDLDVIDPSFGAANMFAAPDGLSPDDIIAIARLVQNRLTIAAVGFASYDPAYDPAGGIVRAAADIVAAIAPSS